MLEEDAAELLTLHAGGERKKAEFLAQLLRDYDAGQTPDTGILERMERRLVNIEKLLQNPA